MESTGYTLARANRLRNIHFPSVQEPENIQFLWFNVDLDDDSMYPNMHTHSFFEIIFVIYGKATHEYMGKKVVLCEKDAILIPPNVPHRFVRDGSEYQRVSFAFSFDNDSVLQNLIFKPTVFEFSINKDVLYLTNKILGEAENNNIFTPVIINNRLNEILYNVFNLLKINLPHSDESTADSRLKVAIEFIKENKNRSISCEDVARECCLSSKQLNRIFKKHTQKTVNDFLTDSRISYAKSLILQKELSVKEISYMLGFENTCGFVSFFKRHTGITPLTYRTKSLEKHLQ